MGTQPTARGREAIGESPRGESAVGTPRSSTPASAQRTDGRGSPTPSSMERPTAPPREWPYEAMRTSPTILPLRGAGVHQRPSVAIRGQSEANQRPIRGQSEANQHSPAVARHNLAVVHEGHRILEQHRDSGPYAFPPGRSPSMQVLTTAPASPPGRSPQPSPMITPMTPLHRSSPASPPQIRIASVSASACVVSTSLSGGRLRSA